MNGEDQETVEHMYDDHFVMSDDVVDHPNINDIQPEEPDVEPDF